MNYKSDIKETEIGLIPRHWNLSILKEHTTKIGSGATPRGGSRVYKNDGEFALIRSQNVFDDEFVYDGLVYIQKKHADELANVTIEENDILLNITGASLGRVHIAPKDTLPARVNQHVSIIRTKESLLPYFLYLYLCLPRTKQYMLGHDAGGTRQALTKEMIENFIIPIPPIEEQKYIAELFLNINNNKKTNTTINKIAETISQTLYKYWFIDFEFPNEEGKPYKSSGGELVYSEELEKEIPKKWETINFGEIINISSGKRPDEKSEIRTSTFNIPLVGASKIMGYVRESIYENPTIIIGRVGTHGVIQRFDRPTYPSDNTLVITSDYYEYVYQYLKNVDYSALNIGSTQPLITQTSIKKLLTILPPQDILRFFEKICNSMYMKVHENYRMSENLQSIKNALLPKLMSGKIRVKISKNEAST